MASPAEDPTPAQIQRTFEQSVTLLLHTWPALTLAVQNNWGGPDSADKRAWFAGAIVGFFPDLTAPSALNRVRNTTSSKPSSSSATSSYEPDAETIEEVLLQVMLDEFEVNVEDESGASVAQEILRFRKLCAQGKFEEVEDLAKAYEARKGQTIVFTRGKDQEEEEEGDDDWEDESNDEEGGKGDVDMDDAPPLAPVPKEKPAPEVDDDGFTKVTRKKR